MRSTMLTALTAAALLSGGVLVNRADAMTFARHSALGVATAHAPLVEQVTNVCGTNGCVPVQTQRLRRHKPHP